MIYRITCPGCNDTYIGKTDRCIITRLKEHGERTEQPMYQHLLKCQSFHENVEMLNVLYNDVNEELHIYNAVLNNFEIVATNHQWSQLDFLEAYYIKHERPGINEGLKASKELQIFR